MKIGPCKSEFVAFGVFLVFPFAMFGIFYNAFEIGTHSATEDAILLAVTIIYSVMSGVLIVGPMVYFGRTITMDSEGCCFSFRGFEKKFRWEELDVQYYKNDRNYNSGHQVNSPGILINVKGRKYRSMLPAMMYCYRFHPMTSVFLGFPVSWDDRDPWERSPMLRGYVMKREELLAVLEELGQCPEVPEIQYRP